METFPTVHALAAAPLEHVLKLWEGLGYYSRARHLHAGAQYIVERHGGVLPSDPSQLAAIKGLGPYTQGAIRAFAFRQKVAAVDGNVIRLLSRYYGIEEPIDQLKTRRQIMALAEKLLPDEEPWLVSEGLIELGATVCKKVPDCSRCPIQKGCLAYRHRLADQLPRRKERPKTTVLRRLVAVIKCEGKILLQKGKKGEIMADLYEFPYTEKKGEVKALFEEVLGLELTYLSPLPGQQHTFTRYRVYLFPHLLRAKKMNCCYQWYKKEALPELPFSSGHRRILNHLLDSTLEK